MSRQPQTAHPYAHRTAARTGGALLLTGGSLAIVLLLTGPGFVHGKAGPTVTVGCLAILVGLMCIVRPGWLPTWALPAIGPFGVVLIGISSFLTRTTTDGSELLYMWTVLYSGYFVPLRLAAIDVALVAVVYPTLCVSILGTHGVTPSVYLVGTSVVTLLIVSNLRRKLTRELTRTALEARTDKLTGMANRRSWDEALGHQLSRRDPSLSVLLIDIDHFKRLNDTYGHAAGDLALASVATVLRAQARQSDVLARVGGEEFALLLVDCPLEYAAQRAEQIRAAVARTASTWATPVTISVGVAALPDHAGTGEELMAAADGALYEAKDAGRDAVAVAGHGRAARIT
jgi:diguanylate cyclase (GGDEF)-like protein